MNKPITIAREEFTDNIVNLVNTSGLPAFVIKDILDKVLVEVRNLEARQLENDKKEWEKSKEKADEEHPEKGV